ncbi:MAG: DUF4230 domain-containing protein [Acutalibacteraceae bacterium]
MDMKMMIKNIKTKIIKSKNKKLLVIFAVILIVVAVLFARFVIYNDKAEIDSKYINAMLVESSELTTAKLKYSGLVDYTDTGITIINKADFVMYYEATIRAGVDVKKIKSEVNNGDMIVWVTIPAAEIQDINIDPSSIRYFDQRLALFNVNEKEDANKAQELALEDAKNKAPDMGILDFANKQAKALIKGILEDVVPDAYEIKFKDK